MRAGVLRFLAAGLVTLVVVGCGPQRVTGPDVGTGATAPATALAFEPVTGIPEERTAVLAESLVSGAIERGLVVVPRQSDRAAYRIKGYFSAARSGSATHVNFAWDVFDSAETRIHRIAGTESVPASLPDAWQAVTDDALRRIARHTVDELDDWLSEGAPPGAQFSQDPPEVAPAGAAAPSGMTALIAETGSTVETSAESGPRVYVGAVAGAVGDGASALARAMAARLMGAGLDPAAHPAEADYIVTGEATVGPVHDAAQTVALIWSVARRDGEDLGTVRQVRRVGAGSLDAGWGVSAEAAAGAAAPGILSLIQAP